MSFNLSTSYQDLIAKGDLRADAAQTSVLPALQAFCDGLVDYAPPSRNWLVRWVSKKKPLTKQGFYLHGPVGRGKSMLMDLFYEAAPVSRKRRVHFHQFMLEIHERLHRLHATETPEVMDHLAGEITAETWLLCFDEFHVANIADAMILGRLFQALFAAGVVIVATSNWPPEELYKNGLQRDRFLPFIELIGEHMQVHALNGDTDHRFEKAQALPGYFFPCSIENTQKLTDIFATLTHHAVPEAIDLPVQGRVLALPRTARGVGLFTFNDLCVAALGSADYLAIAECLHTVLLDGVPRFKEEKKNETLRFINLIDALYEAKVKLYMVMEAAPETLAPTGELAFPYQRTLSRLVEMQGEEYRKKPHLGV